MQDYVPKYIEMAESGVLSRLAESLWDRMKSCNLCPRNCGVNRIDGQVGYCGATVELDLAGYFCHMGEEPPISGINGSGTIFFAHCPLKCVFCQNYSFSYGNDYKRYTIDELAEIMIELQAMAVHNINFVTPEHYLPHILFALDKAVKMGLRLPLVYNTSSFMDLEILRMIEGIFDVFLPDIKFFDERWSQKLCSTSRYPSVARDVIKEMKRQKKENIFSYDGVILNGLIIRHLILPQNASGSFEWMMWIKQNLGKDVYISLMSQYFPFHKAGEFPEICRRITAQEYDAVCRWMLELGLERGWWQEGRGLINLSGENIKNDFKHLDK